MTEFLVVLGKFGSVRVPPLLRSDTCISSEPSTVGKHRIDWGGGRGDRTGV